MARIGRIVKSLFERRASAPGKAVVVQIVSQAGEERTVEMYHPPGISSAPTPEDRTLVIPVGSGGFRIAIGTHNYRVEVEPDTGETIIYSTNAAGDTVQATVKLDASGNVDLNGSSKKFVTYSELNTALQTFVTALNALFATKLDGGGVAGVLTLNISAAETTTVRTGG